MLHSRFAKIIKTRKSALFNINQHYADFLRSHSEIVRTRRSVATDRRDVIIRYVMLGHTTV